jgi:hypothetical protein
MPMKINSLEVENIKRVKAVVIQPTENGLTILGGNTNLPILNVKVLSHHLI